MAFARRSSPAFEGHLSKPSEEVIRFSYNLNPLNLHLGFELIPIYQSEPITHQELKVIQHKLHTLDQSIVKELNTGQFFGHLNNCQFARLVPLLIRRRTYVESTRLRLGSKTLTPTARMGSDSSGPLLELGFENEAGEWQDLHNSRIVADTHAYLLNDSTLTEIISPAPWELAYWTRRPSISLTYVSQPQHRDLLVRQLANAGVAPHLLENLAVQRACPDGFYLNLALEQGQNPSQPTSVRATVDVVYGEQNFALPGQRPASGYMAEASQQGAMLERDLGGEEEARKYLRNLGFRYDKATESFVSRKEDALELLNPHGDPLPESWHIANQDALPTFHKDLDIVTDVKLNTDENLLELDIHLAAEGQSDENVSAALIDMKELLAWLSSGQRFLQLSDGSFIRPSDKTRSAITVLEHLGVTKQRALVSPLCIGSLKQLGNLSAVRGANEATQAWLDEVSGSNHPKSLPKPEHLSVQLRSYQQRGFEWLAMLHRHRLTGILADDMGLGKTVQTLALIQHIKNTQGPKPALVITPTSVIGVWADEAAKYAPTLNVVIWHGAPKERYALDLEGADIIVTSYGIIRRDADFLSEVKLRYVILDEAQSAKNAMSQNAVAIRKLKSEYRLALTGTPIENRPEELWSTFDFLAPGLLGSLNHFRKTFSRPIERDDHSARELLRCRLQPLIMRRLKSEVAKELPPYIETVTRCHMETDQRALYDFIAGKLRQEVEDKIAAMGIQRAHLDILAALTRLRQVCCDPKLLPQQVAPEVVPESAKLALFRELVSEALDSQRCIVVFSQFVEMQKILIKAIKEDHGFDAPWLHGGSRNRDKIVQSFQDPEGPPVIVVSLRAGGTGLTLTRADTVIHYDPWWNPAVERQATDRTHRIGQQRQVHTYKLICTDSIEERVLALASRKKAIADALIGSEGSEMAKSISREDVLSLLF